MDNKLVQIALIASCVCLLVANALTWADIIRSSRAADAAAELAVVAPVRPTATRPAAAPEGETAAPAEAPAEPAEPAGEG